MAIHLEDRWFRRPNPGANRVPTNRHGRGPRYRAHFIHPNGTRSAKTFHHRRDAERWLVHTEVHHLLNGN